MIKQLGLNIRWNSYALFGTKEGLHTLARAVVLMNEKQEEIIRELNRLSERLDQAQLETEEKTNVNKEADV